MRLFKSLQNSLSNYPKNNAFLIDTVLYTYADLAESVSRIRKAIVNNTDEVEKNIGLVANDDLETYAAIIALWFEGKAYVPLNPEMPRNRNENIIKQAFLKTVIDSSDISLFPELIVIDSKKLTTTITNLTPKIVSDQELAYILFTSGTTGQPKGVQITRANLTGFIEALWDIGFEITENDRCLQMAELTFDFSVMPYLAPLIRGACVCTIPKNKIKYNYIYKLMNEDDLSIVFMVPSILQYLRQHFDEINFPKIKFSLFCGEALSSSITEEWSQCIPNAKIFNVYGPTEATVFCTYYGFEGTANNKSHNGILSIGKPMKGTKVIIVDEKNKILTAGHEGQLCLGGVQVTPGYWNNEEKNNEAFFFNNYDNRPERFYKTGDLCKVDDQGDLFYIGRMDFQTQIQGFRVELSEIEFHAKEFLGKVNTIAVAIEDAIGNTEIGLVIESNEFNITPLLEYLKTKMPIYIIPKQIKFTNKIAFNSNGKTDRGKMKLLFKTL